jgi:hypothetical protein
MAQKIDLFVCYTFIPENLLQHFNARKGIQTQLKASKG